MNIGKQFLKSPLRLVIVFSLLLANIGCDQVSKTILREHVSYGERITVIPNHFTMTKVENAGAFLGLGNELPDTLRFILLTLLPAVILLGMLVFLVIKSNMDTVLAISLSFILGGGIGNLYDRILYGTVTDFFYLKFYFLQTGIFNMADVSIMTGTLLLVAYGLVKPKKPALNKSAI